MSGERTPWMERLAREEDNLRSALVWSRLADSVADREIGLRLAGALIWYWNFSGAGRRGARADRGRRWLEAGMPHPTRGPERCTAPVSSRGLPETSRWLENGRRRAKRSGEPWGTKGDLPIHFSHCP